MKMRDMRMISVTFSVCFIGISSPFVELRTLGFVIFYTKFVVEETIISALTM
jgi:hypothetical protein